MQITINFNRDNDAFADLNSTHETARILKAVNYDILAAVNLQRPKDGGCVRDTNGNTIGNWEMEV